MQYADITDAFVRTVRETSRKRSNAKGRTGWVERWSSMKTNAPAKAIDSNKSKNMMRGCSGPNLLPPSSKPPNADATNATSNVVPNQSNRCWRVLACCELSSPSAVCTRDEVTGSVQSTQMAGMIAKRSSILYILRVVSSYHWCKKEAEITISIRCDEQPEIQMCFQ